MENIVEKISKIEHLYKLKGCKTSQIQAAQKELGLKVMVPLVFMQQNGQD